MTLQKLLMQKELKNVNIKIHCVGGSSLIYAYKNNQNLINITYLKLCKLAQNTIKKAKDRLRRTKISLARTKPDNEKRIALLNKRIKDIKTLISNHEYDLSHPILEREVVEITDNLVLREGDCKVIHIEGYEVGKYWFIEECVKDLCKYE